MKLEDLKHQWQQTVNTTHTPDNLNEVVEMLKKETKKVDNEIKRRDILEISISLLLIPFWLYGLMNSAGTMYSLGCFIALLTSLFIPYKMIKAKKVEPAKNTSNKAYLEQERQKVKQQKQLLESIAWWYITPITISIILITLGATVDSSGVPTINEHLRYYYGGLVLLVIGIYYINKRTAKKKFGPLLAKIEQRIAELS